MRTLFIPFAKLLGVYAIFRPLFYIGYLLYVVSFGTISRQEAFHSMLILQCFIHAAGLLLALILIFKTEKIADILKIPHDSTDSVVIDSDSILRIGLVLIGVATIIYALPTLISSAVFILQVEDTIPRVYQGRLWSSILQTVFGSFLMLQAHRVAQFLNKQKSKHNY